MIDIYFLFNNKTQANIGFSLDPKILTGDVLWRRVKIPKDENIFNIKWEGDYSNGKFVRISETNAVVTEMDLEEKFYDRLFRKYGIESIIKILFLQLLEWDYPEDSMLPEFNQMLKFFAKNHKKFEQEIEHFKKSDAHEYQSKEDINQAITQQFKT